MVNNDEPFCKIQSENTGNEKQEQSEDLPFFQKDMNILKGRGVSPNINEKMYFYQNQ